MKWTTQSRSWHKDKLCPSCAHSLLSLGSGCMSEFLPHLGNNRCLAATQHIFQKDSLPPSQKKIVVSSLCRLGVTRLFCIQNTYFFSGCMRIWMPSVKKLAYKCILVVFCLEFKFQCGLMVQMDIYCAICAGGKSKQHLDGTM